LDAVRRVGDPTTLVMKMRVPLSVAPPPAWTLAFRRQARLENGCDPATVDIRGDGLTFVTSEARLSAWLVQIDAWIARANAFYDANREALERTLARRSARRSRRNIEAAIAAVKELLEE
jgi:hypothetical protein